MPALAVADALRDDGARILFIGGERAERKLVPEAGYEFRSLRVQPLAGRTPLGAARAALVAATAAGDARRILRSVAPAAVLGAGGYVAGPIGLAAVCAAPRWC